MYLLKQKFQENKVSSLYLWTRAVSDIKAQEPWQKLKKNTLMILQIILLILLSLLLSRPYFRDLFAQDYQIIIIDSSMSMQAADKAPTRFDYAKSKAASIISSSKPNSYTCIINMGAAANILCNFDNNKSDVLAKLEQLKATNEKGDYMGAKSLTMALLQNNKVASVYLLSDTKLNIGESAVKFISAAGDGFNYAINVLNHSVGKKSITAFTQVSNYSGEKASLPLSIMVDKNVFDAKNVELNPGETKGVFWNGIPLNSKFIEAKIDKKDSLDIDNSAYDVVNISKPLKAAFFAKENLFLEKSLMTHNNLTLFKLEEGKNEGLKGYDLYVFDGEMPKSLPSDGNILILNPPQNDLFQVSGDFKPEEIKKSYHDIFKFVEDYSFAMKKSRKMEVPSWAETVLESNGGVLAFAGELEKKKIIVIGFDLHDTDLPLKPIFPVIINNSLDWLLSAGIKNLDEMTTGDSGSFNILPKAVEAKIISPQGQQYTIFPPYPPKSFDGADIPGFYTLEQSLSEGKDLYQFAVNAPVDSESNIKEKSVDLNTGVEIDNGMFSNGNYIDLQFVLILLILGFLFIEWWVYAYGN
jgi:hypothetical protein